MFVSKPDQKAIKSTFSMLGFDIRFLFPRKRSFAVFCLANKLTPSLSLSPLCSLLHNRTKNNKIRNQAPHQLNPCSLSLFLSLCTLLYNQTTNNKIRIPIDHNPCSLSLSLSPSLSFSHRQTMAVMFSSSSLVLLMFLLSGKLIISLGASNSTCKQTYPEHAIPIYEEDVDLLQFAENIEHLEADFFLWGALGYGLDEVAPELAMGGPPPIGAKKANLDNLTYSIITEFGYEEVAHLRIIKSTVGGFPRPLMDLSASNFAKIFDEAFGYALVPPFDPYRDSLHYMLASYVIPYMGLTGYVGANPLINGYRTKRLLAGLLGVEAGQDAVIRMYLYEQAKEIVHPYKHTVAEFTVRVSELRNRLGMCGIKDEGIIVPPELGAENRTVTNVLSSNFNSLSYKRTPSEILRVLYNTGDEHVAGGFYPDGANGKIARDLLKKP